VASIQYRSPPPNLSREKGRAGFGMKDNFGYEECSVPGVRYLWCGHMRKFQGNIPPNVSSHQQYCSNLYPTQLAWRRLVTVRYRPALPGCDLPGSRPTFPTLSAQVSAIGQNNAWTGSQHHHNRGLRKRSGPQTHGSLSNFV